MSDEASFPPPPAPSPSDESRRQSEAPDAPPAPAAPFRWATKAAEVMVIVVGILVALAGDAWWDGRVERREEREAIASLQNEFTASLREVESASARHQESAEAIRRLLAWTGPQPRLPGGDTVAVALNDAIGTYTTYNDRRGVLEGVIASGGLRLIQNDSLRAMLAGWPAVVEDLTEDEVLAMELRNGELLPYVYRLVPMDGSRFPRDFEALFADPYFERLLFWRLRQIEAGILPAYTVALRDLEAILEAIRAGGP
ncbi:MAG: hypothetical protein ABL963_11045 [Longimicrobiales bacterium]